MTEQYAGFWIRLGASLIDLVIILIVIYMPLYFIYGAKIWSGDEFVYGFWDLLLGYIVPTVATIWFWMRFYGTPGKMATQLKIVDAKTGEKLYLIQSINRYLAYIPAIIPFGLGLIWVGVDKKKQGWHDKMAGTVVIRSSQSEPVDFENNA